MVRKMAKKDVEFYYKKAVELLQNKEYDKSMELLDMVINIEKTYKPAWSCKGIAYMEKEDYPKALESFEKVINLDAGDNLAWYNKGYVLLLMDEFEEARKIFDFFLARYENKNDDFFKYALYLHGKSLYGLKDYEKAIISLEEAIEMDKNFKEAVELRESIKKESVS